MNRPQRAWPLWPALLLLTGFLTVAPGAPAAEADVHRWGGQSGQSGWYPDAELPPGLVGGETFGQMFSAPVDGQVYAQPLVAGDTVLVATEENQVYGLDAEDGTRRWARGLGEPWNAADLSCGDLTPHIGVTGTPVVDPTTGTVYLLSKTYATGTSGPAAWYAHALDVATGEERPGFPVEITGSADNDPASVFNPTTSLQRPGLLLLDGVVYAAFGGHCDAPPYEGWVVGISTGGEVTTRWTAMAGTGQDGAGIWQSGAGLVSDGPGQILVTTGNGPVAAEPTPGTTPPGTLGQAVVRLQVGSDGTLSATDYFAPYDAEALNTWDADLASGGVAVLPEQFGTADHPRLAVVAGKEGYVYLLDRDRLGGMGQGPNGGDAVVRRVGPDGGVWSTPAAWPGDGGYVYVPTASPGHSAGGTAGELHAYRYGVDGSGVPTLALVGRSEDAFGFGSGAPVVTSDGTRSGSALVWIVYSPNGSGVGAQLRAYDPVPAAGRMRLVGSWPIGKASKFSVPAVDGDRVYVGTRDGHVLGFGSPVRTPLDCAPVDFGAVVVGQGAARTATCTANHPLTVTGVTTSGGDHAAGTPSPPAPAELQTGDPLTVPVTFTPTVVGPDDGTLTVTTDLGPVRVALTGTGRNATALLGASPQAVSFGGVAVGGSATTGVTFTNTGATSLVVTGVHAPDDPFRAEGLPAAGTEVGPGEAFTASLTFHPSAPGTSVGELVVDTDAGTVSVPMSGSAATPPQLVLDTTAVDFGDVPTWSSAQRSFTVSNTGGSPLTITKSKPPAAAAGFTATTDLAEGTVVPSGGSVTVRVRFAPTGAGSARDTWQLTGNDGAGARTVSFTGTGTTGVAVPGPADAPWTLNGTARLAGTDLELTDAATQLAAGSAFWPAPVESRSLHVSFDARLDSGAGADGLTLALADPAGGATPTSLGRSGGGLGWAGIPGVAVALDTFRNGTDPSDNFVGVANRAEGGNLVWQAVATGVPPLRSATRHVDVFLTDGALRVAVDGDQVLETRVELGPTVLVGFTAGSGAWTDRHAVSNVRIATVPAPGPPPGLSVSDAVVRRPVSGSAEARFTVSLPTPVPEPVSVTYRTSDSTARAGRDYTAVPARTLTFAPGETTKTVPVTVLGSPAHGTAVPAFRLELAGATGAGLADPVGVGRLLPTRGPLSVTAGDVTVAASTTRSTTATVPLTLSEATAAGETVTVVVATADGTARRSRDYSRVGPTTVTFRPGTRTASVRVPIWRAASARQANRAFTVRLSAPSAAAVLARSAATVTVVRGGTPPPPGLSVSDVVVARSTAGSTKATFRVTLSRAASSPVTVGYRAADGSARAGRDYTAPRAGTLTLAAGQRTATLSVTVPASPAHGVAPVEFDLVLSAPKGAGLADARGTARLLPALGPLSVYAGDVTVRAGQGTAEVPLWLSEPTAAGESVTVTVRTADGTARVAAGDYTAVTTEVVFAPGTRTATVRIPVGRVTATRAFTVGLRSPSGNAVLARTEADVTLVAD